MWEAEIVEVLGRLLLVCGGGNGAVEIGGVPRFGGLREWGEIRREVLLGLLNATKSVPIRSDEKKVPVPFGSMDYRPVRGEFFDVLLELLLVQLDAAVNGGLF